MDNIDRSQTTREKHFVTYTNIVSWAVKKGYLAKTQIDIIVNARPAKGQKKQINDLKEFNKYLALYKYKFENSNNEVGGYAVLKNKNCILAMDVGNSPQKTFSYNYQSGALSFEFFYKDKKLISNSGYFQDYKNKLNLISKSTAAHSALIIDNHSSCSFTNNGNYKTLENLSLIHI